MKKYTVGSDSAVYSDSIQITETTDTNHASNINQAPIQLLKNTVENHRRIVAIENAKVQLAFDDADGGLNIIVKEE